MMKLTRFRVKNFRSFSNSGWIDCQDVTAFAGENESGKTSLLYALLKLMDDNALKNADETVKKLGVIEPRKDLPIKKYDELMPVLNDTYFIDAEFAVNDSNLNDFLLRLNKNFVPKEKFMISKSFSGAYALDIFNEFEPEQYPEVLKIVLDRLPAFEYYKEVTEIDSSVDFVSLALKLNARVEPELTAKEKTIANLLNCLDIWENNLRKSIIQVYDQLSEETKGEVDFRKIFEKIPLFKARVERGFQALTREFVHWWGKDDITINFEPYTKGVLIKIIDKEGNEFLLEDRSTGFRRFFAFFLSFSTSGKDKGFGNTIFLFDGAGAALHPLAQRKLEKFFDGLGKQAQVMYNTHTSYMLSVENLNRVKAVYKDGQNNSYISESLRMNIDRSNELSLFPVQSALALYIAEKQMADCLPIIVLNDEDEYYLSLTKNILNAKGKLNTVFNTLVFGAGENGIDSVAESLSSSEKDMPLIILPSNAEGKRIKTRLMEGKYKKCPEKVLELGDYFKDAEYFEDIMPSDFMEFFSVRYLKEILGDNFVYNKNRAFIQQIEDYAKNNFIRLTANYRSEIVKRMKINTKIYFRDINIPIGYTNEWMKIWKALLS